MQKNQNSSSSPLRTIKGKVVAGAGVGRTIGIRTANLNPDLVKSQTPNLSYGVYSCLVRYKNIPYIGAFYFGPIWRNKKETLTAEVHILDFEEELYNQSIVIEIKHFLRSPLRFHSPREMQLQLQQDINQVRNATQNN